jgi:hypothetical protein
MGDRTATEKTKAKYRGLSAVAAKCAAFGRDDVFWGGGKRTGKGNRGVFNFSADDGTVSRKV